MFKTEESAKVLTAAMGSNRRKMSSGFSNIGVTTSVARSAWVETWFRIQAVVCQIVSGKEEKGI